MTGKMRSFFKVFMIFAIVIGVGLAVATPAMAEAKDNKADANMSYQEALDFCKTAAPDYSSLFIQTMDAYASAENGGGCWFCGIFETIFEAINNMVTSLFNSLAKEFITLMGVGILFLLLFKVGKMLVSLQEVDVMQFLNDLFRPLGRAIIATALLMATFAAGSNTIFSILLEPMLDVSLTLGQEILVTTLKGADSSTAFGIAYNADTHAILNETGSNSKVQKMDLCAAQGSQNASDADKKKAFSPQLKARMRCWMNEVAASLIIGMGMGATLVFEGLAEILSGGVSMTCSGAIMIIAFFAIYIMFPFKMLDAFVRLAFTLSLTPLWIVLWVFPATVEYTKKAWNMFLSSCFLFVTLSIMIALGMVLMNSAMQPAEVREAVFKCLAAGHPFTATALLSVGGRVIMNTICFSFMAWSLLAAAEPLVNSFIPTGGSLNIGGSVASNVAKLGMVAGKTARMVAPVAAKAGGAVLGGALRGGGAALGKFNDALANAGGALPNKAQKALRALGTPLGKGYMDRVNGTAKPDLSHVGQDTASLTPEAAATVGTRAAERSSRMVAITGEKGFRGQHRRLRDMIRDGKTPEERKLLTAMAQDLLRKRKTADAGKVDPRLQRALSDEYARQAIANNPLVKAENQRRQENLDNLRAQEEQLRNNKHKTPQQAYDEAMARARELKQAVVNGQMDRANAMLAADAGLKDVYNDAVAGKRLSAAASKYANAARMQAQNENTQETLSNTQAQETLQNELAREGVGSHYNARGVEQVANVSGVAEKLSGFAQDIAAIEAAAQNAKSHTDFREQLAGREWAGGMDAKTMEQIGDRLYNAKGKGISYEYATNDALSGFMRQNGLDNAAVREMVRQVAESAAKNVMSGQLTGCTAALALLQAEVNNIRHG